MPLPWNRSRPVVFPKLRPPRGDTRDIPFVQSISRSQAEGAMRQRFTQGQLDRSILLLDNGPYSLNNKIDFDYINNFAQREIPWLNVENFVGIIAEMNHPDVWVNLLEQSPHGAHVVRPDSSVQEEAARISGENNLVMMAATVAAVMGVVMGNKVEGINKLYYDDGASYSTPGLEVAKRVGKYFKSPVKTPEELLERLQILFPAGNHLVTMRRRGQLLPLYTEFLADGAFTGFDDISGARNDCPAVTLTKYMFEYYGRVLADSEYQARFLNTVKNLPK